MAGAPPDPYVPDRMPAVSSCAAGRPRRINMRAINLVTLLLVIVGGLNWGLVGLFNFTLVSALFGDMSALSRIVYVLVGISAVWQIMPLLRGFSDGEAHAQHPPYTPDLSPSTTTPPNPPPVQNPHPTHSPSIRRSAR